MAKQLIKKGTLHKIFKPIVSESKKAIKKSIKKHTPAIKERVAMLKPQKKYEVVHIDSGSKIVFSPEGTEFAQTRLKKLYQPDEKSQWLGITPKCQYQIDQGWPDVKEFVNVNIPGSIETEKDNWLGYIGAWEDDENQTLVVEKLNIILKSKRPLLKGKIVKESNGEYRIIIFVSKTSLDDAISKT